MRASTLLPLLLAVGCSNGVADVEHLRQSLVHAECARAVACGLVDAADESYCRDALQFPPVALELLRAKQSIAYDGIGFDAAAAQACIDAALVAPCDDQPFVLIECPGALIGKSTGDCINDFECARGDVCMIRDECPGQCIPAPALGQSCVVSCGPDAVCGSKSYVCQPRVAAGEACRDDEQCPVGMKCRGGIGTTVCTARSDLALPQAGEPCTIDTGCAGLLVCLGVHNGSTGTCGALLSRGGACDATAEISGCQQFLACVSGVCTPLPRVGDPCDPSNLTYPCPTGWCDPSTSRCGAPKPDGASCDPMHQVFQCTGLSDCNAESMTCTAVACGVL